MNNLIDGFYERKRSLERNGQPHQSFYRKRAAKNSFFSMSCSTIYFTMPSIPAPLGLMDTSAMLEYDSWAGVRAGSFVSFVPSHKVSTEPRIVKVDTVVRFLVCSQCCTCEHGITVNRSTVSISSITTVYQGESQSGDHVTSPSIREHSTQTLTLLRAIVQDSSEMDTPISGCRSWCHNL